MASETHANQLLRLSSLHLYRLTFHANDAGLGKIMELYASDAADAVEFIRKDEFRREVDVAEDGRLVLQVSHGASNLEISHIS